MILDLYSKRKKRSEMAGKVTPYKYDAIPKRFRIQIIYIWHETINKIFSTIINDLEPSRRGSASLSESTSNFWLYFHNSLAKEYGVFELSGKPNDPHEQLKSFFLSPIDVKYLLDTIECSFNCLELISKSTVRDSNYCFRSYRANIIEDVTNIINNAVEEVNGRFEEHRLGYELNNKCQIIRKDSKFLHEKTVKKSLELLDEVEFSGVSDEFSKGHNQYRKGEYKEAINNANNAFESTMKTICKKKNWDYTKANGAKQLIDIMFKHELIPSHRESHFNNLAQTLEDGLPTVRNKESGHGQGAEPINVPRRLAQYALNLVATNIVLLVESYKDSLN